MIESFFVSLGFDVNTEKIEEFKKKADELRESVLKVGTIATGAAVGIGLLVEGVAHSMGDLYSFAELNEVSARSVAALGKIAVENDSSMEGMKSTIQSVNKTIGEAALGIGRGAMTFEKLGLSAKRADGSVKDVDDILGEVADKMEGLSRQEQIAMATKLGIDPQFVKVLAQGSENLAKLREEAELLNPFSDRDYKLADEVDKLFIKAKGTLGVFTKMIGVSLLPNVKEVLKNYLEWFKASRKATSGAFVTALHLISSAVGTLWDWVVRLVGGLKSAYDWLTQFKAVTYAAGAALAVFVAVKTYDFIVQVGSAIRLLTLRLLTFNAAALIVPAIIGLIILAIGLLIDDYVNWKEGNESVIGQMLEEFPNAGKVVVVALGAIGAAFIALKWNAISAWAAAMWGAVRSAIVTVAAAATIAGGILPLIGMYVSMAASAVAAGISAAAAWLVAIAPIALVLAAIAAVAFGIYELWTHWDEVVGWLGEAWDTVTASIKSAFDSVVGAIGNAIDGIVGYFVQWWQTVTDIYAAVVGMVGQVVDSIMGGVQTAVDAVMGVIDTAKQKVMGFIDSVVGAIGKVGQLLGLTNNAKDVKVTVQKQGEATVTTNTEPRDATAKPAAQQADPSRPVSAPVSPTPVAQALAQAPAMQNMNAQPSAAAPGSAPVGQGAQSVPVVPAAQPGGVMGRAASNVNNSSSQTTTNTTTISGTTITVNSPDPEKAGKAVKTELDRMNKQSVRNGQTAVAL